MSISMILGIRKIRTSVSGKELPSPRVIGNLLVEPKFEEKFDKKRAVNNVMGLFFGQLMAHDTSNKIQYAVKGDKAHLL